MQKTFILFGMLLASSGLWSSTGPSPLVDNDWIKQNAYQPGVVLLDIRSEKIDGQSKSDYLKGHIPCAAHTDYSKDGWRVKVGDVPAMLPPSANLETLIGGLGIDNDAHVVIVPLGTNAKSMGSATRIFWTFKVLGHDKVSILNGGHDGYSEQNENRLEAGDYRLPAKTFRVHPRKEMIVSQEGVRVALEKGIPLIDNRSPDQYLGINRNAKTKTAGTLPGASNLPIEWLTVNNSGTFRSKTGLKAVYRIKGISPESEQISFCNTGHLASLGWFVSSELLGNKKVKLYDGSLTEWARDATLPIERKITMPD